MPLMLRRNETTDSPFEKVAKKRSYQEAGFMVFYNRATSRRLPHPLFIASISQRHHFDESR
jgi:hypothetical protein